MNPTYKQQLISLFNSHLEMNETQLTMPYLQAIINYEPMQVFLF